MIEAFIEFVVFLALLYFEITITSHFCHTLAFLEFYVISLSRVFPVFLSPPPN